MPVHKRRNRSGEIVWEYQFDAPDSTKAKRHEIRQSGFATRKQATDAEAVRRADVQKEYEEAQASGSTTGKPLTLAGLLDMFFEERGPDLAPKTMERYREVVKYLAPEVLAMPLNTITALHLTPEWQRLSREGGHTRHDKTPRPLSAKTVRNVAGVVSSAFEWYGFQTGTEFNPVKKSILPKWRKREGSALTPQQSRLLIDSAPGWLVAYLVGCR